MLTRRKTFIFYLNQSSIFLKVSFSLKFIGLASLSFLIVFNEIHLINWFVGLGALGILALIGFLKHGIVYFKLIIFALTVFSFIWLFFSKVPGESEYLTFIWGTYITNRTFNYILLATSKWFLLCSCGLLFLATTSQEQLIDDLIRYKLPHEIIIMMSIGFNTISFILESLSDIQYALESRNISSESSWPNLKKVIFVSRAVMMSNIKRISMLRIAYYLDYVDIRNEYDHKG